MTTLLQPGFTVIFLQVSASRTTTVLPVVTVKELFAAAGINLKPALPFWALARTAAYSSECVIPIFRLPLTSVLLSLLVTMSRSPSLLIPSKSSFMEYFMSTPKEVSVPDSLVNSLFFRTALTSLKAF